MGVPFQSNPITPTRTHTAYDLERTLVKFLAQLFDAERLDNPTLNLGQPALVPFDDKARAQSLDFKVAPQVVAGRIPRTLTGEINLDGLPDCPAIIVQAVSAKVDYQSTIVKTHILFSAYDENPESQGYGDVLNMIEAAAIALTSYGQAALDAAYPIVLPIEWELVKPDCFPHFLGEMICGWELPSARPLPEATLDAPYVLAPGQVPAGGNLR